MNELSEVSFYLPACFLNGIMGESLLQINGPRKHSTKLYNSLFGTIVQNLVNQTRHHSNQFNIVDQNKNAFNRIMQMVEDHITIFEWVKSQFLSFNSTTLLPSPINQKAYSNSSQANNQKRNIYRNFVQELRNNSVALSADDKTWKLIIGHRHPLLFQRKTRYFIYRQLGSGQRSQSVTNFQIRF